MQDIYKKLLSILRADAPLKALLGGTTADTRIYQYYLADATVSESLPGYITVALTNSGAANGAVMGPVYTIAVWARSMDKLEPMRDRVYALLHKQAHATSTGRRLYTKQVGEADRFQPQPNFSGKTLQYTAYWLEIRDGATPVSVSVAEAVGTSEGS